MRSYKGHCKVDQLKKKSQSLKSFFEFLKWSIFQSDPFPKAITTHQSWSLIYILDINFFLIPVRNRIFVNGEQPRTECEKWFWSQLDKILHIIINKNFTFIINFRNAASDINRHFKISLSETGSGTRDMNYFTGCEFDCCNAVKFSPSKSIQGCSSKKSKFDLWK